MDRYTMNYNNGEIYFEVAGEGASITFVHGFTLNNKIWKEQVAYFRTKYTVVTYDMRGAGRSSVPQGPYSHHEDLNALLEYLGISKTHLVGLSLGGEVAIDFAVTHPDKVDSLVLADSSLGGYKSTVDWNVHAPEVGIEKAKLNWLSHELFKATQNNPEVKEELKAIVAEYSGWHWMNKDPWQKPNPRSIERLTEIKTPTLIMIGKNDLQYFHDISKVLHENIAQSRLEIISDAGHMINMEKAEQFNTVVGRFISSRTL